MLSNREVSSILEKFPCNPPCNLPTAHHCSDNWCAGQGGVPRHCAALLCQVKLTNQHRKRNINRAQRRVKTQRGVGTQRARGRQQLRAQVAGHMTSARGTTPDSMSLVALQPLQPLPFLPALDPSAAPASTAIGAPAAATARPSPGSRRP